MKNHYDLIVIGGGAAGFFGAIQAAEMKQGLRVLILEKTKKLLSKVKVSGGGRCNVTHHCFSAAQLSQHYPRGEKPLKNLFHQFQVKDVVEWFEKKNVKLKAEEDGRMFPVTNNSQTIIDCFLSEVKKLNIEIQISQEVVRIEKKENHFIVHTSSNQFTTEKILVAIGGSPKMESYQWLAALGHDIIKPTPSLFTFNDSQKDFSKLMGVAVPNAEVKIASTKFLQRGALLITHWGLSGPAVIKLSAWGAEHLYEKNYTFIALVNWTGLKENEVRSELMKLKENHSKKQVYSSALFQLPKRLWEFLCYKAEIEEGKIWAELPNKSINKLIELLFACAFHIKGKTTFKEEFVTCGGISLSEIDLNKMESKKISGIHFAGEVLNIDGETGGFNFQAAWTTSYIAAKAIVDI